MAHHDHDGDESNHRNAPSNQPQVAALGELDDYEVADGHPDVRGWTVKLADGRDVGKVHELIVDTGAMRTRYLDVRLAGDVAGASGDRDVLVPIGTARLDARGDNVLVDNITADQLSTMPAYEHGSLTRDHELAVRRHFGATMGDEATATAAGATAAGATAADDFYAHEHFDDSNFYGDRATGATGTGASSIGSTASSGTRADGEVPLPVSREGSIARRDDASSDASRNTANPSNDQSTDSRL